MSCLEHLPFRQFLFNFLKPLHEFYIPWENYVRALKAFLIHVEMVILKFFLGNLFLSFQDKNTIWIMVFENVNVYAVRVSWWRLGKCECPDSIFVEIISCYINRRIFFLKTIQAWWDFVSSFWRIWLTMAINSIYIFNKKKKWIEFILVEYVIRNDLRHCKSKN